MKKKVLALTGCIAVTAPSISIAEILPENIAGLDLGEVSASTFINQPFKGVIPFLSTSYEDTKNLKLNLAPQRIYEQAGVIMHPVLNSLNFQIIKQDNKPVILISSKQPVQLSFLNIIFEVQGPEGVIYQDYTILLDPVAKESNATNDEKSLIAEGDEILETLAPESSIASQLNLEYRVKAGDTLSEITQKLKASGTSLKGVSQLIYEKNPKAFIDGNINKIKTGALLSLPSLSEQNESEEFIVSNNPQKISQYTVVKGDSLTKIIKLFTTKDVPFTKMKRAIFSSNPKAFINQSMHRIKIGAVLDIPASELNSQQPIEQNTKEIESYEGAIDKTAKSTPIEGPSLETVEIETPEYLVQKGDSLSSITRKIGYKDVPFAQMLKAIYEYNLDAFVDGKMTNLTIGAAIKVPPLSKLSSYLENTTTSADLIKRIRELRKELKETKDSLSGMKIRLKSKEILLEEKEFQIDSLRVESKRLNEIVESGLVLGAAAKEPAQKSIYKPKSHAEIAKFKRELLIKEEKARKQLKKIGEIKNRISSPNKPVFNDVNTVELKQYDESNIVSFTKNNYSYLTMALLLALLLVRYRREMYSYMYLTVDSKSSYYSDKDGLKEQNVSSSDSVMEQEEDYLDSSTAGIILKDKLQTALEPELVETRKRSLLVQTEEERHIEHCEDLITELFDDLDANQHFDDKVEWANIEKVCDSYIEKIQESDVVMSDETDDAMVFNNMMSDLLESLGKVDRRVNSSRRTGQNDSYSDFVDRDSSTSFKRDQHQA